MNQNWVLVVQHRCINALFLIGLFFYSSSKLIYAETIEASTGIEEVRVVSSVYASKAFLSPFLEATYNRNLFGRFSILGQFHANLNNKLSNGIIGFNVDSDDLEQKGGLLSLDGQAEVIRTPIWLYRGYVGLGVFRYVDRFKSQDPALGSRNDIAAQADLIGIKAGLTVSRFFGDRWAAVGGLGYAVATAGNFGINSTSLSFGVLYRN